MSSLPTSSTAMHHLELAGIGKRFGSVDALADVNLQVARGEFVCLLGPSGCGKTTLLRIIAGFESADRGQLLLDGKPIGHLPPHERGFGMVFQSLALFPHMTVAENIAYGMRLRGFDASARKRRVDELLHIVSLPTIADRPVSALSGGQRQRVAIARALAVPPALFLLDEPLSALDAQLRDSMQIELRQLQQQFGVTTVLVTHDQTEAMMLADRLVVMRSGKIQQNDVPTAVYQRPANAFVAEFIGAANMVSGVATSSTEIGLLGGSLQASSPVPVGEKVSLALRPEDIRIQEHSGMSAPAEPGVSAFPGTIEFVRNLGPVSEVIVRCGDDRLRSVGCDRSLREAQVGKRVDVLVDARRCSVFSANA